jgi:simple sugar transport system permease protein
MEILTSILSAAVLAGGVLALAALGEVLSERVGVFNLGLEGLMGLGGIAAIISVTIIPSPVVGFVAALAVGFAFGALFAMATVLFRANQTLCGLALTIFGTGLSAAVGKTYSGQPAAATFSAIHIPYLSDLPIVGQAVFSQNLLIYLAYIVLPVAIHFLLFKTRHGMNLRAVGENPAAADAAGLPVLRLRFWYVTLGAAIATTSGAYLTLAFVPAWSDGITAGRGWIAVALVVFAGYRPINVVLGALAFGVITAVGFVGQVHNWPVAPALLSTLPYLGTIGFMIVPALVWKRMQQRFAAPAALGAPYYRDER